MVKKILAGVFITGIAGFLIWGAINRTYVKYVSPQYNNANSLAQQHNEKRGQNSYLREEEGLDKPFLPKQDEQPRSQYSGRKNRSDDLFNRSGRDSESSQDWITLEGVVSQADDDICVITTDGESESIEINPAAWRYAASQRFDAAAGDLVQVTGFYDADQTFEIAEITNLTTGAIVQLRDDAGHPLWAGAGRNRRS